MGQKVNPNAIRLGIIRDWKSSWYAKKNKFSKYLISDIKIRSFLSKKLKFAFINYIKIDRLSKSARITIFSSRPGLILGKKGKEIADLRKKVSNIMGISTHINIKEIRKPELDAKLVSDTITDQIEKRISFRRAMKRAIQITMKSGALGIKVKISGRLNGAEIARKEWYKEGKIPLHTFRADINYALSTAQTTYGIIGVKVWIFKKEFFGKTLRKF